MPSSLKPDCACALKQYTAKHECYDALHPDALDMHIIEAHMWRGRESSCLVQVLELLYRRRWSSMDGLGALIISPTRELALQVPSPHFEL